MRKTLKSDSHGLYFRYGGYIYRPQDSTLTAISPLECAGTSFKSGNKVKIHGNAKIVQVEGVNDIENWFVHGTYIDAQVGNPVVKHIDSNLVWSPR